MLREQYLGPDRFQRVYDPRRAESSGLRGRGHRGHDNLSVHRRPLSVADNDVVGHTRFLPIQVSALYPGPNGYRSERLFSRCEMFNLSSLLFRRELKCLRNKIHSNLMASYLLAGIMWILNYTVRQQFDLPVPLL